MAQQVLDTVGNTDTLKLGGQKINANFTELYGLALTALQSAQAGAPLGVAQLDANGKVPANQISALQTTEVFPVASQAAMLALTTAGTGDVAVRSDLVGSAAGNTFMLNGTASNLVDWVPLDTGHITLPSQIGAEPFLGNPAADGMALTSSAAGVRSFKKLGTSWKATKLNTTASPGDGIIVGTQVTPGTGQVQLHMDGANLSTTFTDNGTAGLVWTATTGATITNAAQKFGGSSADFTATGNISTPANASFNFGSAGFTVDFQINTTALVAQDIMGQYPATGTTDAAWMISTDATGHIVFKTPTTTITSTFTLTAGAFHHVAVCRVGIKIFMFLDGAVDVALGSGFTETTNASALPFILGGTAITANTGFVGRLDEVRIYAGAGFWSLPFTTITSATPDGTQILGGVVTVTLPTTPTIGDEVKFIDGDGYWDVNNLTVNGNGETIMLSPTDLVADVSNRNFSLVYVGTDWKLI